MNTTSIMDTDLDSALADLDAIVADAAAEESKPAKKAEKKAPKKKAEKKAAKKEVVEPVEEDDADLEAALAELDDIETEAADSKSIQEATEDDLEAALDDVEIEETKKASYEDQPAEKVKEAVEAAKDVIADAESKKTTTRSTAASGLEGAAAIRAKLSDKVYEYVIFEESDGELSEDDLKSKVDSNLELIDTLAKKVREKAVNMFDVLANGKTLSVFTQTAIDILDEKGSLTLKELKEEYMRDADGKKPYSPGTASAQGSQMMKLLPALGIVIREGSELRVNVNSTLFSMLK